MRLALVHYTYPPVIGGVEKIMQAHADLFSNDGHSVKIICGQGGSHSQNPQICLLPELSPSHPLRLEAEAELTCREPGSKFSQYKSCLIDLLRSSLGDCTHIFVHNILSMPFNLAATAALHELAEELPIIAWIHELAVVNSRYDIPEQSPWNLLRQAHPQIRYVAISELRRSQFAETTGRTDCKIIPNGIFIAESLRLSPRIGKVIEQTGILDSDIVILHPTRILRRKNIEFALATIQEIKKIGFAVRLIITGPPDPHNEACLEYLAELKQKTSDLGCSEQVHFVGASPLDDGEIHQLYSITDAVIFPSESEGFGLPVVESGLHRVPIFVSDIPPLNSYALSHRRIIDTRAHPKEAARAIIEVITTHSEMQARKQVMRQYDWKSIYSRYLLPLINQKSR